jgi:dienelactone hydrolase
LEADTSRKQLEAGFDFKDTGFVVQGLPEETGFVPVPASVRCLFSMAYVRSMFLRLFRRRVAVASTAGCLLMLCGPVVRAANVMTMVTYSSTVTQQAGGWIRLRAELNYNNAVSNAPIAVVMHGFSAGSDLASIRENAQRLRDAGFFAISVTMRGREGSQGVRDSGGVEIYDIHDAVEAVKASHAAYVDPANVHITGYSGGGGNAMSALTKFPDYFRLGSAFFGMSDYGLDPVSGWYHNGANVNGTRTPQLDVDIGNPNTGGSAVLDRYRARASNLASKNNPYSEIHLFVNWNESICPAVNSVLYRDNAVAAESFPGEFGNITVHPGTNMVYHDFNGNGRNELNELQYWPHGNPTANQQTAAESWYLARLKGGLIPLPKLSASDELYVAGWVKTRAFECWLGDGQNAAGNLTYSLSSARKMFMLALLSSDRMVTGRLKVDTSDMEGLRIEVRTNGLTAGSFTGGGTYTNSTFGDGQTLELLAPPRLTFQRSGSGLILSWLRGVLLEATALDGPWVTNTMAASPYTTAFTNGQRYHRLRAD